MRYPIKIQNFNPLRLRTFSIYMMTALFLQLMVNNVWADIERQRQLAQVLEWTTLAGRLEFEKLHNKKWEDASDQERKDFVRSLQGRTSQEVPQQAHQPKLTWLLSQSAFKPRNTSIGITLKFPIGFKPNFARSALLRKSFTHRDFIVRSHNVRSNSR